MIENVPIHPNILADLILFENLSTNQVYLFKGKLQFCAINLDQNSVSIDEIKRIFKVVSDKLVSFNMVNQLKNLMDVYIPIKEKDDLEKFLIEPITQKQAVKNKI